MDQVWSVCRMLNEYLAMGATVAVMYRLTILALDSERRKNEQGKHLLFWFLWVAASVFVSSQGAGYYAEAGTTPANWTSGARSVLNVAAILLCFWWPHPSRLFGERHAAS